VTLQIRGETTDERMANSIKAEDWKHSSTATKTPPLGELC